MPKSALSDDEIRREKAKVAALLCTMTQRELRFIPVHRLARICKSRLSATQFGHIRNQFIKAGEGDMQAEQEQPAEAIDAQTLLEDLAAIASKTFAFLGDNEKIGTEEGMQRIVRRLRSYDSTILNRNLNRRLPK